MRRLLMLITMWRERLSQVVVVCCTAFKWGWIPLLLYLGKQEELGIGVVC